METILLIVGVGTLILWGVLSSIYLITFYWIINRIKKYPSIYKNFSKLHRIGYFLLAPSIYFGFYSKDKFNKIFDRLYFYNNIEKTRDFKLIHLLNRYRKFTRFYWFLFNAIFLLVILTFIVVIIIAITIMIVGSYFGK